MTGRTMAGWQLLGAGVAMAAAVALSGCAVAPGTLDTTHATSQAATLSGKLYGGQQPVAYATVQIWSAGTSGYGSTGTLLATTTTSDPDGSFSFTKSATNGPSSGTGTTWACPATSDDPQIYLLSSGGNSSGTHLNDSANTNSAIVLMAAVGPCSGVSNSQFVIVDEVSTAAAAVALAPYMSAGTAAGTETIGTNGANVSTSTPQAATGLNNAVATIANLKAASTSYAGTTTSTSAVTVTATPEAGKINTIADVLAACVNTQTQASAACEQLFNAALSKSGTKPVDTLQAALYMATNPTAAGTFTPCGSGSATNMDCLYGLVTPTSPFQPTLTSAPSTYAVALQPPAFTVTRSLLTFPDNGFSQIYSLINNATTSIDMTMYELVDTTAVNALVAACNRGVKVRVILDDGVSPNYTTNGAYNTINAAAPNCQAMMSNSQFYSTHQKSMVVDGTTLVVLSANLTSQYYANGRDFAIITNDPQDIAAVEDTFTQDYGSTTDHYYSNKTGNDLVWSPTSAQVNLLQLINNATTSVTVENEEMSASNIITALSNLVTRGGICNVIMTDGGSYTTQLTTLKNAGCNVRTYANKSGVLYIQAKVILADYGRPAQIAYMGSINFSTTSMLNNRELGMITTDSNILSGLNTALVSDFNGGTVY